MMSNDKSGKSDQPSSPKKFIIGTIGDTTWRMFTPTLLGIIGGYYLDEHFGTAPWILLGGVLFGAIMAGLLVWRQLQYNK